MFPLAKKDTGVQQFMVIRTSTGVVGVVFNTDSESVEHICCGSLCEVTAVFVQDFGARRLSKMLQTMHQVSCQLEWFKLEDRSPFLFLVLCSVRR